MSTSEHIWYYVDQIWQTFTSRRFQVFCAGLVIVLYGKELGFSEANIIDMRNLAMAWIIGDSMRPVIPENKPPTNPVITVQPPPVTGPFSGPFGRR